MSPSAHIASVFRVESIAYDCLLEASLDPSSPFNDGERDTSSEEMTTKRETGLFTCATRTIFATSESGSEERKREEDEDSDA
eukprot:tig00020939_g16064.t1